VQYADGQTANGWCNARTWPIFYDDNHALGFVEWAEPNTNPRREDRGQDLVDVRAARLLEAGQHQSLN